MTASTPSARCASSVASAVSRALCGGAEYVEARAAARERLLHVGQPPWLGRDSADGHARLADHTARQVERHGRRDQRPLERGAVADLQVRRALAHELTP